jgi:glucose-6-phosphate isomerase
LILKKLNPYNIGNLIALYEHKIFVQSVIWNINAFDQWGVELGKMLSTQLFDKLNSGINSKKIDSSTLNLIEFVKVSDQ